MVELITSRLRIVPCPADALQLALDDPDQFERALAVQVTARTFDGPLRVALGIMIERMRADPEHWLWYTYWQIILVEENRIIGGIDYKGPPGETGCVEIGYGLDAGYEGHGYMTETLAALLDWGWQHPQVKTILAQTYKWNVRSHRVLERAGFCRFEDTDTMWRWKLDRGDRPRIKEGWR